MSKKEVIFPESCPPSSHVTLTLQTMDKTNGDVSLHWMEVLPTKIKRSPMKSLGMEVTELYLLVQKQNDCVILTGLTHVYYLLVK
jgi:hypothetical protein